MLSFTMVATMQVFMAFLIYLLFLWFVTDMDTTEVEATGAELDLLTASKKKRKKKGKSNGLKVVG
jgi:hypothetical protein